MAAFDQIMKCVQMSCHVLLVKRQTSSHSNQVKLPWQIIRAGWEQMSAMSKLARQVKQGIKRIVSMR